ncbi:peptidyl-prolyl cis-trans isomerase [Allomuricauda sp. SCSIO 65647]|uniref:peptidyl-prolyl cis-trans isomerase n=1 Tax=Allomuricauda sp. SCSIO 65647 TaxID=2908843 RepID=UPI001F442F7F|nr:peptidyl-prolyl cis-trans isomerase [Muricauda sp. SCSIO 65647]UJH67990.1 peptidyl-prolyl cis-trans isomerase [Muricauda sp. SCSIO 65647]
MEPLVDESLSPQDSTAFVVNYINNWAAKQLLLSKAKINLSEEQLSKYDKLVDEYRTDLYTRAYLDALVEQSNDTTISSAELRGFYEDEKENFVLNKKLVQLRFVVLPNQFLNKDEVKEKLRTFEDDDRRYLDSIAVQFKKLHLNDSVWVSASRVINEISPLNSDNQHRYLKKSQFFELQDSLGVYLGKVIQVLEANEIAPLPYITPNIRQIILNRRRLGHIKKLQTEIIDEAIKKNEFELYR